MVVWGKNRQGGAALWAAESRPPHSGAALLRRTSVLSQRLKTLAQAIVKHNSRPFWAAPRVRRKFGVQRRIAQGVFISPEQFNFLRYPEKRTTPSVWFFFLVEAGGVEPPSENALTGTSPGADGYLHSRAMTQAVMLHGLVASLCMLEAKLTPVTCTT